MGQGLEECHKEHRVGMAVPSQGQGGGGMPSSQHDTSLLIP